jgi:tetratricopeptide (TPR) repeat protein
MAPDRNAVVRNAVLESAARLVERRRYEEAIVEYGSLVRADPRDARTLLKIGDLHCRLGTYEEAIAAYAHAGDVFVTQGHALKAIATYKKVRLLVAEHAAELAQEYAPLVFTITELYCGLGLISDALALLGDAALALERSGRDREAVAILRKASELDPSNPSRRIRLAEALSSVEDTEGATTELGDAASRLVELGRSDDALAALERLLQQKPDPSFARVAAELYLARGTAEDAITALRKLQLCVRADPKDVSTLRLLARAFGVLGHDEKVDEVKREIAALQGERDLSDDAALPAAVRAVAPAQEEEIAAPDDERGVEEAEEKEESAHATIATEAAAALAPSDQRAGVHVIPVTAESWNAIAARLQQRAGDDEQVIAFVCADGDERSTIRTIYGVVKTLFA